MENTNEKHRIDVKTENLYCSFLETKRDYVYISFRDYVYLKV